MSARVYPLQWPDGQPRTPDNQRKYSRFQATTDQARAHLYAELTETQVDLLSWNWMSPNKRRENEANELQNRLQNAGLLALDSDAYSYFRTLTDEGRVALAEAKRVNGGPVPPRG